MYLIARLILLAAFLAIIGSALVVAALFSPWSWLLLGLWGLGKLVRRGGGMSLWGHGTARWCSVAEMKRAGMFTGNGLILGWAQSERPRFLRSGLRLIGVRKSMQVCRDFLSSMRLGKPFVPLVKMPPKTVHTVVFAPTGAGKGVSLVVPWLLTNPDSGVVIDFKGELASATAKTRRRMGHKVVILDPFKIVTQTPDRINPLDCIDADSPTALDDCRTLAEALVVRTGTEHDPHWNDSAESWIGAIIALVVCEAPADKRNLQSVRSILADPGRLKDAIELMCGSTRWDGMLARWGAQMLHPGEKERGSILSTCSRSLAFLDSLPVSESVCGSTFDPGEVRRKKVTVYLVIPPDRIRTQTGLLRMWVNLLMREQVKLGLGEKRIVNFMLDESAALGKMDSLTELVDKYRGYGMRAVFIYQSQGQLHKCWPEDSGQTLLANCSAVYFGLNDHTTAKEVSERIGNHTVMLEGSSEGTNTGISRPQGGSLSPTAGSNSSGQNRGRSWNQSARALITPDELMRLPQRTAITFIPGLPPVMTTLIRHYEQNLNPGLLSRTLRAGRVLVLSTIVLGLAVAGAYALLSVGPSVEKPQTTPKQPDGPVMFGR